MKESTIPPLILLGACLLMSQFVCSRWQPGQVVLMEKISGERKTLDITGLKTGLYNLTVESGNFPVNTRKLIIQDDY